jgi:hypothetical protein
MAEKLDPKEIETYKDLSVSNTYEQEALVILLEKKGIITRAEVLEEIKELKKMHAKS